MPRWDMNVVAMSASGKSIEVQWIGRKTTFLRKTTHAMLAGLLAGEGNLRFRT